MQAVAPFLTGLGLFFCGVHFVSTNLVPLAGRRFRALLTRLGKRPWLAALFGSVAGVITQSTNAVTSVIIGLVSGGLVDKRRAILIPTWAHVGTSVLVILVAVDLRVAASYLVAITGFAVYFGFDRNDRVRYAVGTLLGLGLLLLGMTDDQVGRGAASRLSGRRRPDGERCQVAALFLLASVPYCPWRASPPRSPARWRWPASSAGLVDLSGACWLIYGANLGSGVNYVLLAKTHRGEAAQIALMQVAQKFAGFAVALLMMAVERVTGRLLIEKPCLHLSTSLSGAGGVGISAVPIGRFTLCTIFVGQIIACSSARRRPASSRNCRSLLI